MADLNLIKDDLTVLLEDKSKERSDTSIYKKNIEFFEELLERKFFTSVDRKGIIYEGEIFVHIEVKNFLKKDIMILQRYLDYLNMIRN